MVSAASYSPELGDHVLVPTCTLLRGLGMVIAFDGRRPIVQSLDSPNITVTLASRTRVVPERCREPEHPDCLRSEELAFDCARWTRQRLASPRRG